MEFGKFEFVRKTEKLVKFYEIDHKKRDSIVSNLSNP